jgi:hypothetical protein
MLLKDFRVSMFLKPDPGLDAYKTKEPRGNPRGSFVKQCNAYLNFTYIR